MIVKKSVAMLLGGMCAAVSAAQVGAPQSPGVSVATARIAAPPSVDHHQHLFSPVLAKIVSGEMPEGAVELPPDLSRLLEVRAERWNDKEGLAKLYSEESLVLTRDRRGWIRGRDAAAEYFSTRFGRPFFLLPVDYRSFGSRAEIAGYYSRGERSDPQYVGYFRITAESDAAGNWLIAEETAVFPVPQAQLPITSADLIQMLDEAGIRRAIVLSEAFWYDGPVLSVKDPYPKVMAENDWTAAQAAQFPNRLVAYCSFSPVADHALRELERCARNPVFRGIKLSFAMSGVELKDPEHQRRLRHVFAAANRRKLSLVVHLAGGANYGREHAEIFLNRILPSAPDVVVQIAHLWGGEAFSDAALAVLAEAAARRDPATRNLYFDLAETWTAGSPENLAKAAERIRQIGLDRILYGSDAALNDRLRPKEAWQTLRGSLPLTDAEFQRIAANVAPNLRR